MLKWNKEKNEKKGKDNVRDLQETLRTNIHIIGSQKEKKERKEQKSIWRNNGWKLS